MDSEEATPAGGDEVRCAECGTVLAERQDREETDAGVFCRPCFNNLSTQIQEAIEAQGREVNYPMAALGGVIGAAIGGLVWWGFTVATEIAFGLVAVVIGITVGKGITLLSGGKRSAGLQAMSVGIAFIAFFYASYLVNRTFILRAFAADNQEILLPLVPDPMLFFDVVKAGFHVMDLVFLAIVVYEAWKIPAPMKLAG